MLPAVSHICNFISSFPIRILLNLKSTPIVERRFQSNFPSINWHNNEDFPQLNEKYRLRNHQRAQVCTIKQIQEAQSSYNLFNQNIKTSKFLLITIVRQILILTQIISQNCLESFSTFVHLSVIQSKVSSSLRLHLLLDVCHNFLALYLRTEELNDFALRIYEKFSEVPRNDFGCFGGGVVEAAVVAQVNEDWVSVLAVDFNLLHNRETSIEVIFHKGVDFLGTAAFLAKELVAGKSQYFKAVVSPSFMSLHHLFVVVRSQSSLACHINNHCQLFILQAFETKLFSFNIFDFKVEECRGEWFLQPFRARLEDNLAYQASHKQNKNRLFFQIKLQVNS